MIDYRDGDVVTEHFRCECGHQCDLVAIACPLCRCEHPTRLGQMLLSIAIDDKQESE